MVLAYTHTPLIDREGIERVEEWPLFGALCTKPGQSLAKYLKQAPHELVSNLYPRTRTEVQMLSKFWMILCVGSVALSCNRATESQQSLLGEDSSKTLALMPLTESERLEDFDAMTTAIKKMYGPYAYKEKKYGFKIEEAIEEYRAKVKDSKNESEATGLMNQFLTRLQDGHVSLSKPIGQGADDSEYSVGILLMPVEGKTLIRSLTDETLRKDQGIEPLDEVLEIDGKSPAEYQKIAAKYGTFGNELSDLHRVVYALKRPMLMTELKPTSDRVVIKIKKKSGDLIERSLKWKVTKSPKMINYETIHGAAYRDFSIRLSGGTIEMGFMKMGTEKPFFINPATISDFKMTSITPNSELLKKHGLEDPKFVKGMFASIYRFKTEKGSAIILLTRISTYSVKSAKSRIAWYKALIEEWGSIVDVMIVDQTHNPGGALSYAADFVSLFANGSMRGLVNFLNADRGWLADLGSSIEEAEAKEGDEGAAEQGAKLDFLKFAYQLVDQAIDAGQRLTVQPVSLGGFDFIQPADTTFNGPVLMLTDELAGSCGDIVPLLMKSNNRAKIFGQRTMGLGGNVEPVVNLPHSRAELRLTRGLFAAFAADGKYDMEKLPENNGVEPDINYVHTVDGVRDNFKDYIIKFSEAAVDLLH